LQTGDVHTEREFAVSDLQGALAVERRQNNVVARYQSLSIDASPLRFPLRWSCGMRGRLRLSNLSREQRTGN
jgi:hypothetical protein